jgi:ferredoxin-like protein FixX
MKREQQRIHFFNHFLQMAEKIHKNKYDYSTTFYKNSYTPVVIKCKIHGLFKQRPRTHIEGHGCPECGKVRILTKEEFVKRCKTIHKNYYSYHKVNSTTMLDKIIIECPIHGPFEQRVGTHLQGKGCLKCSIIKRTLSQAEFIEKANQTHDYMYDYSLVQYKNIHTKVNVLCSMHGSFLVSPALHIQRTGCPKCKASNGERKIRQILNQLQIKFEEQKSFINCKNKYPLRFDFFLPEQNILIEYDGEHHFKPIYRSSKDTDKTAVDRFKYIKHCDKIKNNYALKNKIGLIRIKYSELDFRTKIKNILL